MDHKLSDPLLLLLTAIACDVFSVLFSTTHLPRLRVGFMNARRQRVMRMFSHSLTDPVSLSLLQRVGRFH